MATETQRCRSRRSSPSRRQQEIEGGDVVLIDTREPHEYQEAHLEGGKLVPPGCSPTRSRRPRPTSPPARSSTAAPATARRSPPRRCRRWATTTSPRSRAASSPGRSRGCRSSRASGMTAEQRDRYSRHTLLPEVGVDGQVEAAEREGAAARRRRPRRADRALPGRGRGRHDRPGRRRRRRRLQPAAPGDPQHRADRDAEDRIGAALHRSAEPRRQGGRAQRPARRRATSSRSSATTTSSSTAPTTSPPATC